MTDKEKETEVMEEELDFEELSQVSGGAGLRKVKKEKTVDISEDTIKKMNS